MDGAFETTQLINFGLALALGLLVGMEREVSKRVHHTSIGGIRTFPLSSVIGYLVGLLSGQWGGMIAAAGIVGIAGIAVVAGIRGRTPGITTELALLLTGVVGVALGSGYVVPALLSAVVGTLLLSRKVQLHRWVESLTAEDVRAIVTFAIVAAVVLPLLPDMPLGPDGVLNPRKVWMVVVLVTAINVAGYVSAKYVQARHSVILSAVLGSLVSSTAVTWSLATQSRHDPSRSRLYGVGIAVASCIMFVRVGFYAAVFNRTLIGQLLPVLIVSAGAGGVVLWLMVRRATEESVSTESRLSQMPGNPARLRSALLFGAFYATIAAAAVLLRRWLGDTAVIALGVVSGLADLDAITIAASTQVSAGLLTLSDAELIVIAAMLSNTVVKAAIALVRGDRQVRIIATASLGAMALVLAAAMLRSFVRF
jgi:uncharacterized membrane protein (DUF4010 family)